MRRLEQAEQTVSKIRAQLLDDEAAFAEAKIASKAAHAQLEVARDRTLAEEAKQAADEAAAKAKRSDAAAEDLIEEGEEGVGNEAKRRRKAPSMEPEESAVWQLFQSQVTSILEPGNDDAAANNTKPEALTTSLASDLRARLAAKKAAAADMEVEPGTGSGAVSPPGLDGSGDVLTPEQATDMQARLAAEQQQSEHQG